MVRALQERLGEHRLTIHVDGRVLEVQGRAVGIRERRGAERSVWLTTRERWLLTRLLRRPGAVVSRPELCRAVWRGDADDHVLDVTIARLRRRLGPAGGMVETATKRGYRVRGDIASGDQSAD
jgi:uroporphyrinogen-III synthase